MARLTIDDDHKRSLRVIKVRGEFTSEQLLAAATRNCLEEPPPLYVIWDLLEAEFTEMSSAGLRETARALKEVSHHRAGGKDAGVSAGDLQFGLARMAAAFAQMEDLDFKVESFRTREEAEQWLFG